MTTFLDFFALIVTAAIFIGAIVGAIFVNRSLQKAVVDTKAQLKEKGVAITDGGVSIKTTSRFSREDYIDSTQRAFISGMAAAKTAGSFRRADEIVAPPTAPPARAMAPRRSSTMDSQGSSGSSGVVRKDSLPGTPTSGFASPLDSPTTEKKKKGLFAGIKRRDSTK